MQLQSWMLARDIMAAQTWLAAALVTGKTRRPAACICGDRLSWQGGSPRETWCTSWCSFIGRFTRRDVSRVLGMGSGVRSGGAAGTPQSAMQISRQRR